VKAQAYITGEKGVVYRWVDGELTEAWTQPQRETMMGLSRHEGCVYVAGKTMIHKMKPQGDKLAPMADSARLTKPDPMFHQLDVIDGCVYITATGTNGIVGFDLNLRLKTITFIKPPLPKPVEYKGNYNHINNIFASGGRFYVNLNWYNARQRDRSGVAVLDSQLVEKTRFEHAWESHEFCIINGKYHCVCGSPGKVLGHEIHHPHKAGLMVGDELVFEHNPDEVFLKSFSFDGEHYYLVGGGVAEREGRKRVDGHVFVLDSDYGLVDHKVYRESGQFLGILLDGVDFTCSEQGA
jgi:hypothetical protein